jgi:acyl-coenzyme A synthetase/AMP-(fatty) acid ligase
VVNWRLAAGELDYVINDSGASVLFAGAELLPAVEAIRDRVPGVTDVITVGGPGDGYEAFLATARPAGRGRDVAAEDLWLVMYSSGTTGRPRCAWWTRPPAGMSPRVSRVSSGSGRRSG